MHVETAEHRAVEFVEGEQRTRRERFRPNRAGIETFSDLLSFIFSLHLSLYASSWISDAHDKKMGPCRRVAAALVTLTEMKLHGNS